MSVNGQIKDLCRQMVTGFNPQKIILFGSYAYGKPNEDSDLDFLVVMPFKGRSVDQAIRIRKGISTKMPLDLMVRTPLQIEKRLKLNDFFIKEAIDKGRVLYESEN